jgi:hypothetical protein
VGLEVGEDEERLRLHAVTAVRYPRRAARFVLSVHHT